MTRTSRVGAFVRSHPFEISVATLFVVLKVVYVARALQPATGGGWHLITGSDSPTYTNAARASIFSKAFYESPGPFGFLVLLKLVRYNVRALVIVQTVVATAAWLGLAISARSAMRTTPARLVGFAGVLATGLAPAFVMYDVAVATESVAMSLAVVVLALAIRLAVRADSVTVIAFVVALTAAAFTHDVDAVIAAGVGALALLALAVPRWRREYGRRLIATGLILLVVAGVEVQLSNSARRWYWPTAETLIYRVAATHDGYQWLVAHGMPDDGAVRLMQDKGYFLTYPGFQAGVAPYQPLRHWLDTKGRSAYTRYLLTHPVSTLTDPRHTLADQLTPAVEPIAIAQHIRPDPVTRAIGAVGLPSFRIVFTWAMLAFGALVWALWIEPGRRRRVGFTVLGIGAVVAPHALAVFHGDVLELARHSLSVALHARVVVWLATAFAIDTWVTRRQSRRTGV